MPFPANIDLSTLDGTNGFKLSGEATHSQSGFSVRGAGDVNGDGFADVIIGAPPGTAYGAASYVVFGKASGFSANLELSSLDGTNGFELNGLGNVGWSVSGAGDVNGDGFADVIVGARADGDNGSFSGASWVVFGSNQGFNATLGLSTVNINGTNGFRLGGEAANDQSGFSVASAGDVNGDGFDDVIVGAPYADPNGTGGAGASYVVFGKASGFTANLGLSTLDGTNGFRLSGETETDFCGTSVSSAGDVNGDGFADLIVGARSADNPLLNSYGSGVSYVVFGKASGFTADLDLATLDGTNGFTLSGIAAEDDSGDSVSSAGDVNGDGLADIIIGNATAAYVVFGKTSAFATNVDLSGLDGTDGFKLSGAASDGAFMNHWAASAGDVNGDGFDDVIIGSEFADPHGADSGASYVVFGKASGFDPNIDLSILDGTDGFKISGVAGGDNSGGSVDSAGDVNGDGFADLIIGARFADPNGGDTGASYVVFGIKPDTAVNRVGTVASQTLSGGDFSDILSGLGGNDALWGNGGNDLLNGGLGNDILRGGAGIDTASYTGAGGGVTVNLSNAAPQNTGASGIDTLSGIENLIGWRFADTLIGNGARNVLSGSSGNDRLQGEGGNDLLLGGVGRDILKGDAGRDVLTGGSHRDVLTGGADRDLFDFNSISESKRGSSNRDTITDFRRGTDDIDLRGIDAKNGVSGNQKFKWIGKQDFHDTKGELRYIDKGSTSLVQGDVNGDGKADFEILVKVGALGSGDFLL